MFLQRSISSMPLALFTLLFVLAGCAKPHILLERAVVKNATDSRITDVLLRHEPTKKVGRVNAILPQKSLDIGFPSQPMLANKAVISWRDGAGQTWEVVLDLPYDQEMAEDRRSMQLIYVIQSAGRVSVNLHAVTR